MNRGLWPSYPTTMRQSEFVICISLAKGYKASITCMSPTEFSREDTVQYLRNPEALSEKLLL